MSTSPWILLLIALGSVAVVLGSGGLIRLAIWIRERRQQRRQYLAAISVSVETIRARQNHPHLI